jgi:hypothetical protein
MPVTTKTKPAKGTTKRRVVASAPAKPRRSKKEISEAVVKQLGMEGKGNYILDASR